MEQPFFILSHLSHFASKWNSGRIGREAGSYKDIWVPDPGAPQDVKRQLLLAAPPIAASSAKPWDGEILRRRFYCEVKENAKILSEQIFFKNPLINRYHSNFFVFNR